MGACIILVGTNKIMYVLKKRQLDIQNEPGVTQLFRIPYPFADIKSYPRLSQDIAHIYEILHRNHNTSRAYTVIVVVEDFIDVGKYPG